MRQEHPGLTVVADADALAETAAERIVAHLTQRAGRLAVCLAGGSTPERLYRAYAEGELVWLVDRDAAPEQCDVG
jgi:6-phosphogluconolactonase/glucosamine-6-phosphate isomerase/deaminase